MKEKLKKLKEIIEEVKKDPQLKEDLKEWILRDHLGVNKPT